MQRPELPNRINQEQAFLLTSTPWRESSLRIEIFSRQYGRLALLARSARKRQSELRGILVPFVPLSLSWYGKNDLRTLHRAEWLGGWAQPMGKNLLSALYINELILKLIPPEDPHPVVFQALGQVMQSLSRQELPKVQLRLFEWRLLTQCGFTPDITQDSQARPILPDNEYRIYPESGVLSIADDQVMNMPSVVVHGQTLLALQQENLHDNQILREVLYLNRLLLDFRLPENICSRRLLQQMDNIA